MSIVLRGGKANSSGVVVNAGPSCWGFMLAPGVPSRNEGQNSALKQIPGSFPVRVRFRGSKEELPVRNSQSFYFDKPCPEFDIIDCDSGDVWDVYVFDSRNDGIMRSGNRVKVPVRVSDAVALPAADPALATDGFPLRPNLTKFTVYFSGVARVNTMWVRQLDGTWFNMGDTYDAAAQNYATFDIGVPGDRWILRPAGGTQTVVVEGAFETD
jgi:hypothetical protein